MATTRRATTDDLPFMIHILCLAAGGIHGPRSVQECHDDPAMAQRLDLWTPRQTGLVCLDDGRCIGACWLTRIPADATRRALVSPDIPELTIGIAPDLQGHGHGSYLLSAALEVAEREGVRSVSLVVDEANERAAAMFAHAGFSAISTGTAGTVMLRVR